MLVTTVPRLAFTGNQINLMPKLGFGSAMWWMLLHICCAGVILSTEKSSAVCIKTDAFNRQLIYTTTSFIYCCLQAISWVIFMQSSYTLILLLLDFVGRLLRVLFWDVCC
uniref:Uncharacterized protein n=1 Tax=Rhipicephalus microplus TaxID=6941 RepID=A0A6G5ABQ7_RHIMP